MKTKITLALFVALALLFHTSVLQAQCSSTTAPSYSGSDEDEWFTLITASATGGSSTIDYSYAFSGSYYGPDVNYINDYATQGVTAPVGSTVTVNISRYAYHYTGYLSMYVDWDNDGTYESTEYVGTTFTMGSGVTGPEADVFTVPATAVTGTDLHMRVFLSESGATPPCSGTYGQAIDFYMYVQCTAPTVTASAASSAVCPGDSTTITSAGGATYAWSPSAGLSDSTGATVSAAPAATTTYTIVGTSASGCSDTIMQTITVNPLPSITIGGTTSVCSGTAASLTATGASSYTWSPAAGLSSTTGSALTANPAVTTTYTITGTSAAGCTDSTTQTVTVTALPSITAGAAATICSGSSATLSASGGTTYSWSPATGLTATTGASISADPTATTTYTVTGTSSGCSSTATETVTVNSLPTITAGPAESICAGSSTTLTAAGGTTYSWSPSAGLSATTGASITADPAATTTYTVTGTAATGCHNTAVETVTVNSIPVITASAGTTICAGSSTALMGSGGTTYSWSPSVGLSATTGASITASPTVTTTYTVTGTASGCSSTATSAISVNPQPAVGSITFTTPLPCIGGTLSMTATPGTFTGVTMFTWSGPGLSTTTTTTPAESVAVTSSGIFTVTATDPASGCVAASATAAFAATTLPSLASASNNGPLCVGESLSLMANSPANVTAYSWSGPGSFATTVASPSLTDVTAAESGTYALTVYNGTASGCMATYSTTVTVHPLPAVYTLTGGGSYCPGTSGVLVGLSGSATGVMYQLYDGATATGAAVPGTGAAISFGTLPAGTYTVSATTASTGCTNAMTGTETVTINPSVADSVYLTSGPVDSLCAGASVTFSAVAVNGGSSPSYQWLLNGFTVGGSGNTYTYVPSNGDVLSTMLYSSLPCLSAPAPSYSVAVTVSPNGMPAMYISAMPAYTVCQGTLATFSSAFSFGGNSPVFKWLVNGADEGSDSSFSYYPQNGDVVSCVMYSNYTCKLADSAVSNEKTMNVEAYPIPSVEVQSLPAELLTTGTIDTFVATVYNAGINPHYQWYINDSLIPYANSDTYVTSSLNSEDSVSCMVTSHGICGDIQSFNWVIITEFPAAVNQVAAAGNNITLLPNPNSGTFRVQGMLPAGDQHITLEVVNMTGQVVYGTTTMAPNGKLDEYMQLGSTLPNGVYLLHIDAGNQNQVIRFVLEN